MDAVTARTELAAIETALDTGGYKPGPWAAFLRGARGLAAAERRELAEDVSRVSDKLHGRSPRRKLPVTSALAGELLATAAALALCCWGLEQSSAVAVLVAMLLLVGTLQPLVKVGTGLLLGVRYSYAFLMGLEPRFKMRYGSYLAAAPAARVLLHLSGTVGSPLGAWLVGRAAADAGMSTVALLCTLVFWPLVLTNVVMAVAALAGRSKLGPVVLRDSSGGAAAQELKAALAG